jgi:hypothetical protein
LIRVPESFGQKERGGESKKKFQPILFLGFWDRFELYAIIVKKIGICMLSGAVSCSFQKFQKKQS